MVNFRAKPYYLIDKEVKWIVIGMHSSYDWGKTFNKKC